MTIIATILPYIQITLAIILVVAVLFQHSEAGAGGAFGGGDGAGLHHTRRGFEKFIFITTIVIGSLFVMSTIIAIFIK